MSSLNVQGSISSSRLWGDNTNSRPGPFPERRGTLCNWRDRYGTYLRDFVENSYVGILFKSNSWDSLKDNWKTQEIVRHSQFLQKSRRTFSQRETCQPWEEWDIWGTTLRYKQLQHSMDVAVLWCNTQLMLQQGRVQEVTGGLWETDNWAWGMDSLPE